MENLEAGEDSWTRLESGELLLRNNVGWNFGAGNNIDGITDQDFLQTYLARQENNNQIVDPQGVGLSRTNEGNRDPRPSSQGPAAIGAMAFEDEFFDRVDYPGAFDSEKPLWLKCWTALANYNLAGLSQKDFKSFLP